MDNYDEMLEMAKRRRDEAIEAAKAEFKRASESIDIVRKLSRQLSGSSSDPVDSGTPPKSPESQESPEIQYGWLSKVVRESVESTDGTIGTKTVVAYIEKNYPAHRNSVNSASIAGALNRLKSQGVLDLVQQPSGRAPAQYKRIIGTKQAHLEEWN